MAKNTLKVDLLIEILANKNKTYNVIQLANALNKDYKNTYQAIKELKDSLEITKKTNSNEIKFKPTLTPEVYKAEYIRKTELLEKPNLKNIQTDVEKTDEHCIVIIFGSYAKNTEKKNSDIDICIIHPEEKKLEEAESWLSLRTNIETHTFTTKQFKEMLNTVKHNVGHEIKNHGITIKNTETFYEVMKP